MIPQKNKVKNLLIDLGGVLYQIRIQETLDAYKALIPSHDHHPNDGTLFKHPLFKQLDQGKIEIDDLAEGLIEEWNLDVEKEEVKKIWLELLVGLYPNRTASIQELSKTYNIALLSNTSKYHFEHYRHECGPMFEAMDHLFFSFDIGLTKPDPMIYQMALEKMGWEASETMFLDDSQTNVQAAKALGIQTVWIEKPEVFEEIAHTLIHP
ncbi:MAG: HAD family phosphatase [Bacteroidota bacterium]